MFTICTGTALDNSPLSESLVSHSKVVTDFRTNQLLRTIDVNCFAYVYKAQWHFFHFFLCAVPLALHYIITGTCLYIYVSITHLNLVPFCRFADRSADTKNPRMMLTNMIASLKQELRGIDVPTGVPRERQTKSNN